MKIEVTEMEGSLLQSLRDPEIKVLVNGKYPVKGVYQNMNTIIIESDMMGCSPESGKEMSE